MLEMRLSSLEVTEATQRRLAAMRLQEIEGNPLNTEQVTMFEMFEREGCTHAQRLAHIKGRARAIAAA